MHYWYWDLSLTGFSIIMSGRGVRQLPLQFERNGGVHYMGGVPLRLGPSGKGLDGDLRKEGGRDFWNCGGVKLLRNSNSDLDCLGLKFMLTIMF